MFWSNWLASFLSLNWQQLKRKRNVDLLNLQALLVKVTRHRDICFLLLRAAHAVSEDSLSFFSTAAYSTTRTMQANAIKISKALILDRELIKTEWTFRTKCVEFIQNYLTVMNFLSVKQKFLQKMHKFNDHQSSWTTVKIWLAHVYLILILGITEIFLKNLKHFQVFLKNSHN